MTLPRNVRAIRALYLRQNVLLELNGPVLRSRSGVSAYEQAGGLLSLPGGFSRYHHPAVPPGGATTTQNFGCFFGCLSFRCLSFGKSSLFIRQVPSSSDRLLKPLRALPSPFGPSLTSCVVVFRVLYRFFIDFLLCDHL